MKCSALVISTLLGLLIWSNPASAQHEPIESGTGRFGNPTGTGRGYQNFLYGVIKKIDTNEILLTKTKFGVDQNVRLEAKTKVISNNRPSSRDKLKVGDPVFVDYRKNKKTGELIAKKVIIGAEDVLTP